MEYARLIYRGKNDGCRQYRQGPKIGKIGTNKSKHYKLTKRHKMFRSRILLIVIIISLQGCSTFHKNTWIKESDKVAEDFSKQFSALFPERGSDLGYQEFDSFGVNPTEGLEQSDIDLLKSWKSKLTKELATVESKDLKVDLLILLDTVETDLKWKEVDDKLGKIPFYKPSESIYNILSEVITDQSSQKRKDASVQRFQYYMSDNNKKNIIDAYHDETLRYQEKYKSKKKFYPFRGAVEKYLENSSSYVTGIKELLEKTGTKGWEGAYKVFQEKIKTYDNFVKTDMLPKSRKTPNLPLDVYQLVLKDVGVDSEPEDMIELGKREYKIVYKDFEKLAKKVAKKHHLKSETPQAVIAFLKKKQVSSIEEASVLYNSASERLEDIIRKNDLVTLPNKKLIIRFAGDAESKANPVPHLNPPPLINNVGILPEFVVPTSSSGKLPFDDFSYESGATILTAHEGRPGHDLQFSRMLENPTSIVRTQYAANSVNVEGWALYAEDIIFPYLSDEEKLIAYQTRLWRIARYFLDPLVQSGRMDNKEVTRIFHNELGVSKVMAGLEYDRYTFGEPGQATAYYHGLLNIIELKKDLSLEYGQMQMKCFNDTLLSFGLLPHKQIRIFKEQFKKCSL